MKIFKRISIAVISFIIICLAVLFLFPDKIFDFAVKKQYTASGLIKKEINVDNHKVVYFEGGTGPETVVLIHGFGADKTNWIQLVKNLPGYHFIIPDLPGFGESTKFVNEKYDVVSQAVRLNKFLQKLGLKKFSIAGNSMGGNISAVYSFMYPDKVKGLILLDNLGITAPVVNDLTKLMMKGENPLIVKNRDDYKRLMKFVFAKEPDIPFPFLGVVTERSVKNSGFNQKVFKELMEYPAPLEKHLAEIKMPVLIIWGDKDQLLDVSCVPVLEKGIRNHTTRIMKDCGHAPMIERPEETAGYIKAFIATLK